MVSGIRGWKSGIRQDYFQWLCEQMHVDTGVASYWLLFNDLHSIEFVSYIAHDENRAADGIALREEYFSDSPWINYEALEGPCTVLEMMVGLSKRMDFEMSDPVVDTEQPAKYFWEMLSNLGLMTYSDDAYVDLDGLYNVKEIVENMVERNYEPSGRGGLFPRKYAAADQREVEIWYQMQGYLQENYELKEEAL